MPIPLSVQRYYSFIAGIDERTSQISKDSVTLKDATNVDFYVKNAVRKRNGYIRRIAAGVSSTDPITGMFDYRTKAGSAYFVATSGATIKHDVAGTWTDITGAAAITSDKDNKFSFAVYNDILMATNGVDDVLAWKGAGNVAALSGSPPSAVRWIAVYNEHTFLARNSTNRSRLYISIIGDPETWGAADYVDIGKDDGQEITGLVALYDRLFIFKRKSIYQLSGTSIGNFRVDLVSQGTGACSGWSIAVVENTIIFLSDRGFYEFGGSTPVLISDSIHTTMLGLNQIRTEFAHGIHYKRRFQYWCSVSDGSSTTNNLILVYDYINKAWSKLTGINANCFALEQSGVSMDRLYHGDYDSIAFLQDSGNVDDDVAGNAIAASFTTHPIDMGAPELYKRFRFLRSFFDQEGDYNITITYKTDFGSIGTTTSANLSVRGNQSLWGVLVWGVNRWGGDSIVRPRSNLKASGHHLELQFANNSGDQPFLLHGFSIMARVKGPKRASV
jgi:hypothetical protein